MPKTLLRYRVPLGFLFAAGYLVLARPASVALFATTAVFVVLGCALRSWAAGYLFKGKRVAVGGPYAYVRNPLYLGSFIIGVGCCIALWRNPPPLPALLLWTAYIVGYGIVYPAKTRAEEGELKAALGAPYEDYARRVPRFLPTHGHVADLGVQHFSTELYRRNREYQCLLGSAAILGILFIRYHYGR